MPPLSFDLSDVKTTLAENTQLRLFALCSLYFAQGVPWGFVTISFAAWIVSPDQGLGRKEAATIIGIASLPYSFKFIWGPLVDRFSIPGPSRRRPWIIAAQGLSILTLTSMLLIDDLPGSLTLLPEDSRLRQWTGLSATGPLVLLILLSNMFVSIQDVAVDALAIDLLSEKERGIANGLMFGSSYLGTAVGGAGLGWVIAKHGIGAGIAGQALLIGSVLLIPLFFKERPEISVNQARRPKQQSNKQGHSSNAIQPDKFVTVIKNLITAFSLRSTILGLVVALTVKLGIGYLTPVFIDYLQNEARWSMEQYTQTVGGWALALGLIGSVSGGFLADQYGPHRVIIAASILLSLTWAIFGLNPEWTLHRPKIITMLLLQEYTLALITVGLFALFMSISWPRVGATQFTAYMAMMNFSNTIGSLWAGKTSEEASISSCLYLAAGIQVVIILPLLLISPNQTRQVLGDGTTSSTDAPTK